MGQRSHHTALEGDAFCLLEMNVLPEGPCEDAGGNRYKSIYIHSKRVLYRYNLKGRSARNKPLLQNHHKKARLQFATAHGDKDRTFWRNVLWSDETKIELFGHNDHRYVWECDERNKS